MHGNAAGKRSFRVDDEALSSGLIVETALVSSRSNESHRI
jgi:hypothetical protein